ncbi:MULTISPECIES: DUF3616 domain-containing protein [unclassified Bosea (in: a-proteobacteria)]|uniref:DUF3616 domain-containing protein n=1 Tax=unclassified Bosea (in: a-proteobacteria) TaxID=2653178 RepID=UPI000F75D306|nr:MULTISPECIES: DUF3616 domain-containing protein [unclassified Bosea (in: a-proteobacteria)]AZO80381.1 hypothetical protein BLM15_24535 [Bosea sp. Tri-49]RXT23184.1 hypothetical protein B5U98_11325 [Bosea sp. Tri-39]RXT38656.1 hypothetical protein B5U99_10775 [Bosea sp. Tri-54]
MRLATLPVLCALALLTAGPALAESLKPERRIEASSDFAGKKGKAAKDISGIACRPPAGGEWRCLVVNDESKAAQFATLTQTTIRPERSLPLIGDTAPAASGRQLAIGCPKQGGFGEFDGEGVAYADRTFYVVGSHGCSRHGGEYRPSSFLLARIPPSNGQAGAPELSWRVSDLLAAAGEVAPYLGKPLDAEANGLNIEGLAVVGDRLWLGLRAPSLNGRAFLVGGSVAELFKPGNEPAATKPQLLAFSAGAQRGVRDLATLADGRLLVLVGPTQEQDVPYAIVLLDPADPTAARELGELRQRKNAKAEALTVLAEERDELRIIVGYDGVKNGEFEEYRLKLR